MHTLDNHSIQEMLTEIERRNSINRERPMLLEHVDLKPIERLLENLMRDVVTEQVIDWTHRERVLVDTVIEQFYGKKGINWLYLSQLK